MGLLDGRVAIVTGASKGIGREIAQRFAADGAKVICAARTKHLVEETVALIEGKDGDAIAVVADAATETGAQSIVEAGIRHFAFIDSLVNNAGDGGPTQPVQDYSTEEWLYTLNSCLTSSYMCTRFAVPHIIAAGGGSIVNISSMAGKRGLPYRVGYCAAKAGQIGMTYGLALELGPHKITVNAIAPGAVEGDRIDRMMTEQAHVRGIAVDTVRQRFLDRSPLKRMATADDIASLAVFLCSDQARSISGQCIPVTAGEPA
jgi:NAD(P)-dependent dehydrogenase (short-subunit alcohol dehydrogenase family)